MDKKAVVHIHNIHNSAIEKNTFESVLMRWMKLEPILQIEIKSERKPPIQYTNAYTWNLERL